MLCTTTTGHILQGANSKLFSDGLISMKVNAPVIIEADLCRRRPADVLVTALATA